MINKENFLKLSAKNKARKIFYLLDDILLSMQIKDFTKIEYQLEKIIEYLSIFGKYESYKRNLEEFIKNSNNYDFNKLKNLILSLRESIFTKYGFSYFESDFSNYTKYGNENLIRKEIIVILDNIRSPFNVGSIIRSAEAFGFKSVFLVGISSKIADEKINRTSMNAEKFIEVRRFNHEDEIFNFLNKLEYKIYVIEKNKNSRPIYDIEFYEKCALVVGNEEFGVSDIFIEKAINIIEIPQYGIKNSINVASAFSIAAFWISNKI